jgi:carboxyl-terminal processing protease
MVITLLRQSLPIQKKTHKSACISLKVQIKKPYRDCPKPNVEETDIMMHWTQKKILLTTSVIALSFIVIAAVVAAAPKSANPYFRLKIFAKVLSQLERYYVEPVDKEELIYGAIHGMVRTLDPHSSFMRPEDFQILEEDTRGEFGGVGLEVGFKDDVITVITPIPGSPAEKAGIEPGDQLIAINKKSTQSMSIEEAIRMMRGKPGTTVTATFQRAGADDPFDVTLERTVIQVDSVEGDLLGPGFPWIRVRIFQDGTTADVKKTINRLKKEGGGLKGLILDLRRNPGGVLHEAVLLSDLFISKGVIVTTRGQGDKTIEVYTARRRGTIDDVPMVALVDGASASAAEIVAGALQDHGRAMLVGVRSYGKGSVQSLIDLGDGFGLKLTVARYFTPLGRSIQVEGVTPDITVESRQAPLPDPETAAVAAAPGEGDLPGHLKPITRDEAETPDETIDDYQLRIALQLLKGVVRQKNLSEN